MTPQTRAQIEEAGFDALHRLYAMTRDPGEAHAGVAARFLLGLYNGTRFPFDLTDLRLLSAEQLADAMAVLVMDARVTRQEVHTYFADGSRKFEDLVADFRVVDLQRLKATGDVTAPAPRRVGVLHDGDEVGARLVRVGEAPGYRDVSLELACELLGPQAPAVGETRITVRLGVDDAREVMEQVRDIHRRAWQRASGAPIDGRPGEVAPSWVAQERGS